MLTNSKPSFSSCTHTAIYVGMHHVFCMMQKWLQHSTCAAVTANFDLVLHSTVLLCSTAHPATHVSMHRVCADKQKTCKPQFGHTEKSIGVKHSSTRMATQVASYAQHV